MLRNVVQTVGVLNGFQELRSKLPVVPSKREHFDVDGCGKKLSEA